MFLSFFCILVFASFSESFGSSNSCKCSMLKRDFNGDSSCLLGPDKPQIRLSQEFQENNFDIIEGSKVSFVCETQESNLFTKRWFRNETEINACKDNKCTIIAKTSIDVEKISCQILKKGIFSVRSDPISLNLIQFGSNYAIQPLAVQKYYAAMEDFNVDMACGNIPIGSTFSWIDCFNKTVKMPIKLTKESFFTPYACEANHTRIKFTNPRSKYELIIDPYDKDGKKPDALSNFRNIIEVIKSPKNKDASLLDFIESYYKNYTFDPMCDIGLYHNDVALTPNYQFNVNMKLNLTCGCKSSLMSTRIYPKYSHRDHFEHRNMAGVSCEFLSGKKRIEYIIPKQSKDRFVRYKLTWQKTKDARELQFSLNHWNNTAFVTTTYNKAPLYESYFTISVYEDIIYDYDINYHAVYEWRKDGKLLGGYCKNDIFMNNLTDSDLGKYTVTVVPCALVGLYNSSFDITVIQKCLKWASLFPALKATVSYSLKNLTNIPATPKVVNQANMLRPEDFDEGTSTELDTPDSKIKAGDFLELLCLSDSKTIGMSYQWMKDGQIIPVVSQIDLNFGSIQEKDKGDYTCIAIHNGRRSSTSEPFVLNFNKTYQKLPSSAIVLFLIMFSYLSVSKIILS